MMCCCNRNVHLDSTEWKEDALAGSVLLAVAMVTLMIVIHSVESVG